jgi:hypothetical protein
LAGGVECGSINEEARIHHAARDGMADCGACAADGGNSGVVVSSRTQQSRYQSAC